MGNPLVDFSQVRRAFVLGVIYTAIIAASFYLAYEVRFDFLVPQSYQEDRFRMIGLVIAIKLLALATTRQFGSMMTYFSLPDLLRLTWAMLGSTVVILLPRLFNSPQFAPPRGVLLTDFMLCLGALCMGRLATRMYRERLSGAKRTAKGTHQQQQRIAIVGAGDVGASLAKEFLNAPWRGFRPVMFFDDDPDKHGKLIHGIPVIGPPEAIDFAKDIATLTKAVIAMPSASARRIRDIVILFTKHGLKVETLPSLEELASGRVKASRIRPVEVQDLLGRDAVNLDSEGIKHRIENRCVMVTGAGGSIGSELCRQIARLNPKRLLLVEQCEGALFLIEQELNELGLGAVATPLVADILDERRMDFILARYQPQVIFHAAAHKHVYLMERQPAEAIRNNVLGTRQLATLAANHQAEALVLISTDKAINPTSVMGATKRLAEIQLMKVAAAAGASDRELAMNGHSSSRGESSTRDIPMPAAQVTALRTAAGSTAVMSAVTAHEQRGSTSPTKFMAVRFGNVLGSSGSVIPIFKRQIANGGPVTVTHPDVTRYFMTIPEAVGLVLQSFVLGKGGEIFVLDMGRPVKIVDLAKQMIELSGFHVGDDIEIKYTGLKPGEKLFEELQHHSESHTPTEHPRIMRFTSSHPTPDCDVLALERRLHNLDSNQLKSELKRLVPEYTPFFD